MFNFAICDDNELDLQKISKAILFALGERNLTSNIQLFQDPLLLLSDTSIKDFDAVFLDIDMPKINGIDVVQELSKRDISCEFIFVTNHDELVFKTYKYKALGFVRKKFLAQEIDELIEILIENLKEHKKHITINNNGSIKKVKISEIIYIQSDDHYVDIYLNDTKELLRESIGSMEDELSQYGFIRTHSRYLVNYRYIYSIEKNDVVLDNSLKLPISRNKLTKVKELFHYFLRRN